MNSTKKFVEKNAENFAVKFYYHHLYYIMKYIFRTLQSGNCQSTTKALHRHQEASSAPGNFDNLHIFRPLLFRVLSIIKENKLQLLVRIEPTVTNSKREELMWHAGI